MLEYVDFEIKIERRQEREYVVSVSSPPGGEASGTFTLPFPAKRLKDIRETIEIALLRSMMPVRRVAPPEFEKVREFGHELYSALFKDEVKSCFDRSFSVAFREGKGLRLKLRLDSTLTNLPWEFMYSREIRDYLALCRTIPPVRYTELPQPVIPLEVTPPLRILVVIASPSDYDLLNVERERERITSALGELQERGIIKVEFVEGKSTLAALQRRLRRADYHVLHFIGHGDYDEEAEEGLLLMEDARGRGRPVSGQWLGRLLRGYFPMRLVVLNACEGALTSSSDPFAGVAAAVVGAGVPAVVAMQFEISDEAAIIFSREFYSALADNYPVDAAVTEARIAIVHSRENTIEWATPVLYMRAPDGMLFALQEVRGRKPEEEKLSALYAQAKSLLDAEKWSEAIARCEEILAINPGYRDTADLLAEAKKGLARQETEVEKEKRGKRTALYERVVAAIKSIPWPAAAMGGAALLVVLFGIVATVKPWGWLSTPTPTPTPTATPTATATSTPTSTVTPTSTPTYAPTSTFTPVSTPTPTSEPPTDTPRRPTVTPTSARPTDTPVQPTTTPRPTSPTPGPLTLTPSPPTTPTPGPIGGTVRVIDGVEMVYVPAGPFEMGSESGDSDERPVHTVTLDAFWIDRYEVTNAQYVQFLNAVGGHANQCEGTRCIRTKAESESSHIQLENGYYLVEPGYEDHPVILVSWYGATGYCEWRGRNAPEQVRLPSEAEWEKAASWDPTRGAKRVYPWGNEYDGSKANAERRIGDTTEVGTYEAGKSAYGAYDMAGNVWEWVADRYGSDYYSQSPSSNPQGPSAGTARVRRGGSWIDPQNYLRAALRGYVPPDGTGDHIGFRCAASPGPL